MSYEDVTKSNTTLDDLIKSKNIVFLIGNGINRAYGAQSWESLINNLVEMVFGRDHYLYNLSDNKGIFNTEIMNILESEIKRQKKEVYDYILPVINECSKCIISQNNMLDFAKKERH